MRTIQRQWWVSGSAAVTAAAIQVSLLAPMVLGTARHRPPQPDQLGGAASALVSSTEAATSMTLVDLQQNAPRDESALEALASQGIELTDSSLVIASPEASLASDLDKDAIEDKETTEAAGDAAGHAAMFGRYVGQIDARIEHAWMRPRAPVEHKHFSCQAKIEQDPNGRVMTVELRICHEDVRWQRSLVDAIQRASPLPSPPIPSVFAKVLTLNFGAEQFEEGVSSPSDYEPAPLRVAAQADALPDRSSNRLSQQPVVEIPSNGEIELHIEGNEVSWKVHENVSQAHQSDAREN